MGVEGGGSLCVSSRQQNLMKSWRLRREEEGHPGCQGRAAAHYCGGVPWREGAGKGGGEDLKCQGTGCHMDAGRQLAASNYCWEATAMKVSKRVSRQRRGNDISSLSFGAAPVHKVYYWHSNQNGRKNKNPHGSESFFGTEL